MDGNVTERILDRVDEIVSSNLCKADDHQVRRCLLDYLGCAIGGSTELAKIVPSIVMMGMGETRIVGSDFRTSKAGAAFASGFCSHVLELDDGHRTAMQHVGSPVFSVLLSLCDERMDWSVFSRAVVCGYEVAISLGESLQPHHKLSGFHATGTCGVVGATAAACVMLGYDRVQTKRALTAAATSASGLLEVIGEGSALKPYNVAHACAAAVIATGMGASSYDGPVDILGGRRGLLSNFGGDVSRLKFGTEHRIHGVYTKPYSACRHCHSPIECVERICAEKAFNPEDIVDIRVDTYELAVFGHDQKTVVNPSEARMSTPFGIAAVICGKGAGMEAYSQVNINDDAIRYVMEKVHIVADKELTAASPEKRGARVAVALRDGTRIECLVEYPKGEPENRMSDSDLEAKTFELARFAGFDACKIKEIVDATWTSSSINDLKDLCCV